MSGEHTGEPKRRQGRPKTFDKKSVLDVAICAYWNGDPADASVNAICKLAGVSKPSLYREFGGEDGLTSAALDDYAENVLQSALDILSSDASFAAKLDGLIHFAGRDPRFETGCMYVKMRATRERFGAETQAKITELEAASFAAYVDFLQRSLDSGEWAGGAPVELAARYLNEQVGLALAQRGAGEDPEAVTAMLTMALSIFRN